MNKRGYLIIGMIVLLIVAILFSLHTEDRKDSEPEKSTTDKPIIKWTSDLDTTEYFLPPANSEPRKHGVTHVLIHFMSNALNNPQDPYDIEDIYDIFVEYEVSAHYVIDREGKIYLFVPENHVAYHAGKGNMPDIPEYENRLNRHSIGIELLAIGTREEMIPMIGEEKFDLVNPDMIGYTDAQYETLNELLDDIQRRHTYIHKDRKHIIGHDEYAPGRKTDPGSLFDWSRIGL